MAPALEPFFAEVQPGPLGQRFCLWHTPPNQQAPTRVFVQVHAFAEEMNKSRRMAAQQARAMAAAGYAVLQIDLLGCGDSAGTSGDATWQAWLDDVHWACNWVQERFAQDWPSAAPPEWWLWGHRAGCLLANEVCKSIAAPWQLLFWQPSLQGKTVLQQFLRLHTLGVRVKGNDAKTDQITKPKERLAQGHSVEVAGYVIQPALAVGLDAAALIPTGQGQRLTWLDVAAVASNEPNAAQQNMLTRWQQMGWAVQRICCAGPSFWQTTEIEDAPDLISTTLKSISAASHGLVTAVTAETFNA